MSKNKCLIVVSLLVVVCAATLLELRLRQSRPRVTYVAANAFGAGIDLKNRPNGPGISATTTQSQRDSNLTSQRPVVSGGAGAGKARVGNAAKPPSTSAAPQEVIHAAETGLPLFLGQIPAGSKELYGFASTDDLSAARLGAPLQMLTITPAALQKSSSNSTVSSLLSQTTMWFFPIQIESESKAMLVVDRDDAGTWKAVSLGYAGLGHESNGLLGQWPASKGFAPQLIAVFQARQFYFTVPQVDDFNLTQIRLPQGGYSSSTTPALAAQGQAPNYGTLSLVSRSLEELKPIVLRAELQPMR